MDVTDVVVRLLRQRLAVGLVVLLAVLAAGFGYSTAGTSRQAGAAVVIVPPKVSDTPGGDNPLLNLDNNMAQLAVVLSAALRSSAVTDQLLRQGATADFTISTATSDNPSFAQLSPQLIITATGSDDATVSRTVSTVVAQAKVQLDSLQDRAGVAASARATLLTVVEPTTPEQVSSGRLRSAGALGLGVLVLGLVAVIVVGLVRDLRRRRRREPGVPAAEPADVPSKPAVVPKTTAPANGKPAQGQARRNGTAANATSTKSSSRGRRR